MYRVEWAGGDASDWQAGLGDAVEIALASGDNTAAIYERDGDRPIWEWHDERPEAGDDEWLV